MTACPFSSVAGPAEGVLEAGEVEREVTGRRWLPDYEPDVYGPLPFSEEVTGFLEHELKYISSRQKPDGYPGTSYYFVALRGRPRFLGSRARPSRRSNLRTNALSPSGRPVLS